MIRFATFVLIHLLISTSCIGQGANPHRDEEIDREFIRQNTQLLADTMDGELANVDIQKLNYVTTMFPDHQIWRSVADVTIKGGKKQISIFFIDLLPEDEHVLPLFYTENGKRIEIPNESTQMLMAKRAAHFIMYQAKLFNEPDGVNENGLNIHHFSMENGESFRGHLISRRGETVTIELLPTHLQLNASELSEADQEWIKSAATKK